MVIAGYLHLRLVLAPRRAAVGAGGNRQDVSVVRQPHADSTRHAGKQRAGPLEPVPVHHTSLCREAEARIEPTVVEEQQPGFVARSGLDIALDLVALVTGDAADRRAVARALSF